MWWRLCPEKRKPEFLLMTPFTPRNRDNLIGLMMARCDGEHLGEKVVLLLSKQEIILGPMQIEARINQDQNISKDLTLWNQQGSQVLRGQMLVLPIEHTFLYVEPIYIQASQAKMPQLKKVALAMGNNLVYADTYQQALAQLAGEKLPATPAAAAPQPRRHNRTAPGAVRRSPTHASPKSASISNAIGNWSRKESCRKPARNWKRSKSLVESKPAIFDSGQLRGFLPEPLGRRRHPARVSTVRQVCTCRNTGRSFWPHRPTKPDRSIVSAPFSGEIAKIFMTPIHARHRAAALVAEARIHKSRMQTVGGDTGSGQPPRQHASEQDVAEL